MTDQRPTEDPTRTAAPEPSTRSQVDIAHDVQTGLKKANSKEGNESSAQDPGKPAGWPVRHRATEFDGDPAPAAAEDSPTGLKPRDDTPNVLEKKEGPRQ